MKKQSGMISKIAMWFSAYIFLIGLFFPTHVVAQIKKVPSPPAKIYWYLDYTVTVKGNGKREGDASGAPEIVWSIDRTYSASLVLNDRAVDFGKDPATLMNPQNVAEAYKSQRKLKFTAKESKSKKSDERDLGHVQINDELKIITEEPCSDDSTELTFDVKNWKLDATLPGLGGMYLSTDDSDDHSSTYNVWIPVWYPGGYSALSSYTSYGRTKNVRPSKTNTPVVETKAPVPYLPNVRALVKDSVIEHIPARPYPLSLVEYDSGDMTPDKPLIEGVPDSKTNVKVRVIYRLSKTPLY